MFLELIPAGPALVCRNRCTPSDLQQLFPARRHLADRDCARPSPPRARGRIGAAALGLPAGAAKGSERIAEIQVEIHSRGRGLVLLRRPWRPMPDGAGRAFTLLTTEPGSDVAPIQHRQMVLLDRSDWLSRLDLTRPEAETAAPASRRQRRRRAGPMSKLSGLCRDCVVSEWAIPG